MRSHIAGKRTPNDSLTDVVVLAEPVGNWCRMLWYGLEAGDIGEEGVTR